MLGILLVVYTFNFIDRQILSILLESIKHDLTLTEQALGFLAGFAFAAVNATLGIPLALWADRGNRRNLTAVSLALWSAMTAACGLAQNFVHLARIGVGIGEADCSPPSHSIIADCYPAHQRATAIGIYALGIPLDVMFGLFVGGRINELFGWRQAFLLVGLPGLALARLVRFTVPFPRPGFSITVTTTEAHSSESSGHAEGHFDNVRVLVENILLGEGRGFEIAQGRLGPGRIHHCMRLRGAAQRALECACRRAVSRSTCGRTLAEHQSICEDIARCYCAIEQACLLTLETARKMDEVGAKDARDMIAAAKITVPLMGQTVIDRCL